MSGLSNDFKWDAFRDSSTIGPVGTIAASIVAGGATVAAIVLPIAIVGGALVVGWKLAGALLGSPSAKSGEVPKHG